MDWRTEVELLETGEPSRLRICGNGSISVVTGFLQRRPKDAMSGKDLRGYVVILRFHQSMYCSCFSDRQNAHNSCQTVSSRLGTENAGRILT